MIQTPALAAAALYAGALTMVFGWLVLNVSRQRGRLKIWLGDGGNPLMLRAMRGEANFVEQVPLAVLLLVLAALMGAPAWVIHAFGILLLAGRILHASHFTRDSAPGWLRHMGATLSLGVLMVLGLGVGLHGLWRVLT